MKAFLLAGVLSIGAVTLAGAAPADPHVAVFAQNAGLSNEFELAESKIILEDSTNPALRAFAHEMIHDHGMAQQELRAAAAHSGAVVDLVFDRPSQAKINDIGLMDGQKLDQAYLADQVQAHASAAADLSSYAMNGTDPALRAYARRTLPVVLHHQRMLEELTGQPAPL